jgi:hypothetical protein
VSLHDGVGDERGGDLLAAEPAAVQAIDRQLGGVDRLELHVDLALTPAQHAQWYEYSQNIPGNHARP